MKNEIIKHPLLRIPAYTIALFVGFFFLENFIYDSFQNSLFSNSVLYIYILIVSLLLTRDVSKIRWNFEFKSTFFYFGLALFSMTFFVLINFFLGGSTFLNHQDYSLLSLPFLILIYQSIIEEVVFRGVVQNLLTSKYNEYISILITSILFTIIHLDNNYINIIAIVNIFLASIFLGLIYSRTRSLINAISFHLFWNLIQSVVFGVSVSGMSSNGSILTTNLNLTEFNSILIGDEFGFESGLLCTILLIIFIYFQNNEKLNFISKH